ncbi:hypothetical protein L195_g036511, partial [Trifolium pratense]
MINQQQRSGDSRRRQNQGTGVAHRPHHGSGYSDPLSIRGMPVAMPQPMPGNHYLHPGCEALTDIISVCYFTFRSNSTTGYSTTLPECAFAYYCAVACYWRLLYLQLNNGLELTDSEVSFVHQLKSMQLHVPQLFGHYLSGFGNTTIPSGRDVKFRMRKVPKYYNAGNATGWFGRVSADTQPFYQNYPCLAVYVARMFASLDGAKRKNNWWNFPAEIQPLIAGGLGPSPACIGYGPPALPINTDLLLVINTELRAQSGLQLLPLPETLIGTVGQICFTSIEGEHDERTTRASPMTLRSSFLIPAEVSLCASAFAYRVHHAVDEAAKKELPQQPWVVWRFGEDAPADWAQLTAAGNSFREGDPKVLSFT